MFVKKYQCIFLLWTIIFALKYADTVPVIGEEVIDFSDDWDYRVRTHSIPLLNGTNHIHELPPVSTIRTSNDESRYIEMIQRIPKKLGDAVRSPVSCSICVLGVGLFDREIKKGTNMEDLRTKFITLCVQFRVTIEAVCAGTFDVFGPEITHVMQYVTIGPKEICSLVLGETCGDVDNPLHEWTVELPEVEKPSIIEPDLPKKGAPTFKVLHITDTHYDPYYTVGSVANCQEPFCCRANSTPPEIDDIVPAGKWGSYGKCDVPKNLIINMMKHITEQHPDIDYIIWTGDLPPHDVWNQTKEGNLDVIRDTVDQMFEMFPNVPVFPALGNHESVPAGHFPPPWVNNKKYSVDWLYKQLADHWRRWLPATAGNTVLHGAFYSVLIRPGFRLIALNTNYCHTLSWWLVVKSTDPAKELQWLIYELQQAEDKGEKVHIIGHIPPGNEDCMKVWAANFYNITNRYENTIVAQFYGHTHNDELELFYDTVEPSRATNIAYLAPSVTTYENNNPAYRIYYIDGDHNETTREVVDHETWTTNLKEANENDSDPVWYKLYSAKDAYGLSSLRPGEWAKLVERMVYDEELFNLFMKYYYRDSPTRPSCDNNKCKLQVLCDLKSGRAHDRHTLCHDLELAFGE